MSLSTNSQTLRAIGQALENERLEEFDLENQDGDFLVRGRPRLPEGGEMLIHEVFRRLRRQGGVGEFRYSPEDIDQLEKEGRAKRQNGNRMPDFYQLSQLLRTVGAYVDQKGARFCGLSRHGSRLTLQYQMGEGQLTIEAHEIPSFYNFFVQLYLRRGIRQRSGKDS